MRASLYFSSMTTRTYPRGTEREALELVQQLSGRIFTPDEDGNWYYDIPKQDGTRSRHIFAAHLDDVSSVASPIVRISDGRIIRTDGKTILGADDKAGVAVMLYMMSNRVAGRYYLFHGEESGRIGSEAAVRRNGGEAFKDFDAMVCFDRRGYTEIITHQAGERCASDDYAKSLAAQFQMSHAPLFLSPSTHGVYTDSYSFRYIVPECINISAGYDGAHSVGEWQNLRYLDALAQCCVDTDWDALPIVRKAEKPKYEYGRFSRYDDWDFPSRTYATTWNSATKRWEVEEDTAGEKFAQKRGTVTPIRAVPKPKPRRKIKQKMTEELLISLNQSLQEGVYDMPDQYIESIMYAWGIYDKQQAEEIAADIVCSNSLQDLANSLSANKLSKKGFKRFLLHMSPLAEEYIGHIDELPF